MKKSFVILLIIWDSSLFSSGNRATDHLQFQLGCQAVIPCQHYRSDANSLKWFYKKDVSSDIIRIFFQDKTGVKYHQKPFHRGMRVLRNGSLATDYLREEDQGLYWCESCFRNNCRINQLTDISLKKEILQETDKKIYVTEGNNFTHACPVELSNLKWTFKASKTAQRHVVTSNKSMHIVNVKRADAGKYSCWTSGCDGHRQNLLTINLCVVTVHHSENSPVSCAAMCDVELSNIKPNSTSTVETDTVAVLVHPYGFVNCSAKQMFDGYSTVNSTHGPSNVLNKTTTDKPTEPEYQIHIYVTSAALTCLILMVLLICYLRPGLRAALTTHLCCCDLNGRVEEETSVVYSSVVIRGNAKTTNNHMTDSHCVYSEIKI